MNSNHANISAVDVYLEKRKSRVYVGQLTRENSLFIFTYSDLYIYSNSSIPLGPDLSLTQKIHRSKTLFSSFEDRIPSKKNPAYKEYCKMVGIDPTEKDLLVLVATLGQKGPSSFIFSPVNNLNITSDDIKLFRKVLNLTVREFSDLFDFSPATITKLENKKASVKDAMKRLEIYYYFPEVALYEVEKNLAKIHENKQKYVKYYFQDQLQIKNKSGKK